MAETIHNSWRIIRYQGNHTPFVGEDIIATEFPFTIVINGTEFATIVCSPTYLLELAVGFLASEGIIHFFANIKHMHIDETQGFAYIELHKSLSPEERNHSKRFIGSCCGKSRQFYFKNDVKTAKTITNDLRIANEQCLFLMEQLQNRSKHFQKTGGVHNAALCTTEHILVIRTDIGRHNALDKLYGHVLKKRIHLKDKLVVFSGRISSEILLKISKIGVSILISKSAPTDLALRLANDLGITVIGFARGDKMNVYTHPNRISKNS
ncbi:MAG TPA: formate dehydrogenase accessory sulfurtransferase FdhD [Bacillota bacterium]|nr:formate dehydrogenase accessory sulfurtransferase FdhD [Bacillota bacterium]